MAQDTQDPQDQSVSPGSKEPEFGLVKTADGPEGERFWIVRLHVERGTLERTMRSLDEQAAREQLVALGCPPGEIDELFRHARKEFGA